MQPFFSVIVPNYNHAPYLEQRIESILNQSFQDFELILLDDCSTDTSTDVLLQYKKNPKVKHLVINTENSGSTFLQWDKGLKLAAGKYIWIAESDDWAAPEFLETMHTVITNNENIGLAYVSSVLINSNGEITFNNEENNTGDINVYTAQKYVTTQFLITNPIWNASALVFKNELTSFVLDNGYKSMKYCGDWFFYVQLCSNTSVVEIKKTLNYYRVHDNNVSNKAKANGLYFIEGFQVFTYIAKKYKIDVLRSLSLWAKTFVKHSLHYKYNPTLKHQIYSQFINYSRIMSVFVAYWKLFYFLKRYV